MADADRDRSLLLRAAALSRTHMERDDGGPFGAVVATSAGVVVADGWNQVTSTADPTAHAEMTAIRRACAALGTHVLAGHVLYTSCEPCPMCLAAVIWARMDRVVFANSRDDAARIGFDDAAIYDEVARPIPERTLRCERIALPEAKAVFDAWTAKTDRIPY